VKLLNVIPKHHSVELLVFALTSVAIKEYFFNMHFLGKVQVVAYNACPIAAARVWAQEDGINCEVLFLVMLKKVSFTCKRAVATCTDKASMCFVKVVDRVRVSFNADCHVPGATAETPSCLYVLPVKVKIVAITFTYRRGEDYRSQAAAVSDKFTIFGVFALVVSFPGGHLFQVERNVPVSKLVDTEFGHKQEEPTVQDNVSLRPLIQQFFVKLSQGLVSCFALVLRFFLWLMVTKDGLTCLSSFLAFSGSCVLDLGVRSFRG